MIYFNESGCVKESPLTLTLIILGIVCLLGAPAVMAEVKSDSALVLGGANTTSGMVCGSIIKEAYRRMGVIIDMQYLPSARALALSIQGKTDGEACRILSVAQRSKSLVRVPVPYLSFHGKAFSIKPSVKVMSPLDLAKYKSRILNGMVYSDNLTRKSERIKVNSATQLFRMLISEHLNMDLVITTELTGRITIAQEFPGAKIHMAKTNLVALPVYHYLHVKNKEMATGIETILKGMLDSGETYRMKEAFIIEQMKK